MRLYVVGQGHREGERPDVSSLVLTEDEYEALRSEERCRCVRRPAGEGAGWLYAHLMHLDGVHMGLPCINMHLANSDRLARPEETANCCIMLDWEDNGYLPVEQV